MVPVSSEAPTHPVCAGYSALICPAIGTEHALSTVVAITPGEYPLVDRWIVPDPDDPQQTRERFVPHDTPRLVQDRPRGALEFLIARLDTGARFELLAEWMAAAAPQPYRQIWLNRARMTG